MTESEGRNDRFTEIEDRFANYEVYDQDYDKIGKVDYLFVDEHDDPEYIGVKMGLFGLRGSTLIPWEMVRVNDERRLLQASAEKECVKDAPSFTGDQEITPEFERQVREHYGLGALETTGERGAYGAYYPAEPLESEPVQPEVGEMEARRKEVAEEEERPGVAMGDVDHERAEFHEHPAEHEGLREGESDLHDEDEIRVQRTEEELRAGTRERETGSLRVRKRVVTDRERLSVPKRREEVHVERVPVEGEAAGTEIGEDEIRVPVTEEEAVVEKRPVKKEEVRIRKEPVEEEEVVEEDVRREEIDVDDQTEHRER